MTNKRQDIFLIKAGTFADACNRLMSQIGKRDDLLKITVFNSPDNNEEYTHNISLLNECAYNHFAENRPLIAYVAQPCVTADIAAEVTYIPTDEIIKYERHDGYTLLHGDGFCELITEGITPTTLSGSIRKQSEEIFDRLGEILSKNKFTVSDIYRQWNYIEYITSMHDGRQNYQEFNDARSRFYNNADWTNGYPAATGIGTSCGGVMVEVCAVKGSNVINHAIDNPVQISAHNYSQKVLTGITDEDQRTTPKFERARIVGSTVYISGTAAIKGEESLSLDNATEQTAETMQIIKRLVSTDNIPITCKKPQYTLLRVYIKNNAEATEVVKFMESEYPKTAKHYLIADVCRPELLVEIEGMATAK